MMKPAVLCVLLLSWELLLQGSDSAAAAHDRLLPHHRHQNRTVHRLHCLQKAIGAPVDGMATGEWVQGHADANDDASAPKQWLYQDFECPLLPFDARTFCESAVGCGKKVLIVGDSTVKSASDFYEKFFQTTRAATPSCPTPNNCNNGIARNFPGAKGCVKGGHNEKMRVNGICTSYCSSHNKTQLTYVRHDFLAGAHGVMHFKTAVCDHWMRLAGSSDIVVISSAAHIHELVTYPNETVASPKVPFETYVDASAYFIADKLKKLKMKPNSVLVYMTSSGGIENFTNDCSLKPADKPLPYDKQYNWDKIPYMQATYVRVFKEAMREIKQPFFDYGSAVPEPDATWMSRRLRTRVFDR